LLGRPFSWHINHMKFLAPLVCAVATSACAQTEQSSQARAIEAMGQFDITVRDGSQRVTTKIDACTVQIDTTATSGARAGQLDHRDVFRLGASVTFADDDATPPSYAVSIIPGVSVADDPTVPIQVAYKGTVEGDVERTVPVWKNPREPFSAGPTIDGVEHVIGQRKRGGFILASLDQAAPASAFVAALISYEDQFCRGGTS